MNTHCKRGHEFTPENTIRSKKGRACRVCAYAKNRISGKKWSAKNRASIRERRKIYRQQNIERARELARIYGRTHKASIARHNKLYRSTHVAQLREYRQRRSLATKDACPCCGSPKKAIAAMCRKCWRFAIFLAGERGGIKHPDILNLVSDVKNPTLQRSYTCLKNSRNKLTELQQQISQTGKLPIMDVLALLRETASALLAEC